jgi:imidazolonepropionase-like amidohydrolase
MEVFETPPTRSPQKRSLRAQLAVIKAMHDAGVTIVAGTDYGLPGFSLLRELELYVEAGLTPLEAIRAATVVPSTVMKMSDDVGAIEAGKRADLLVLDADPLADIHNLRTGRWVVALVACSTWRRCGGRCASRSSQSCKIAGSP